VKLFNILLDNTPEVCEVGGKVYQVNTDFRVVLAYLRLCDGELSDEEKAAYGLSLFFENKEIGQCVTDASHIKELVEWRGWFLRCGRDVEEKNDRPKSEPAFDLLVDSGRIYAAFYQVYRINLRTAKVHWWVFMELLNGLPVEGTRLSYAIEIRGKGTEKWMTPAQKNALAEAKDYYSISRAKGKKAKDIGDQMADIFRAMF